MQLCSLLYQTEGRKICKNQFVINTIIANCIGFGNRKMLCVAREFCNRQCVRTKSQQHLTYTFADRCAYCIPSAHSIGDQLCRMSLSKARLSDGSIKTSFDLLFPPTSYIEISKFIRNVLSRSKGGRRKNASIYLAVPTFSSCCHHRDGS